MFTSELFFLEPISSLCLLAFVLLYGYPPLHICAQSCRLLNGKLCALRSLHCMPHFHTLWESELVFFNHLGHNDFSRNPTLSFCFLQLDSSHLFSFPHLGPPLVLLCVSSNWIPNHSVALGWFHHEVLGSWVYAGFVLWGNEMFSPPCPVTPVLAASLKALTLSENSPWWLQNPFWVVIAYLEPVILHSEFKLFSPSMH